MTEIKNLREIELPKGARSVAAVLLVALALAFPAAAVAAGQDDCAGPAGDQYCPQTQILTGSGSDSGDGPGSGDASGDLPFTGLDLGIIAALGAVLVGTGLVLRRSTRASKT